MKQWLWVGLVVALRLVPAAQAQEQKPADLNDALASSRRIPGLFASEGTVPADATVITSQDIARSGATTIQDVLARSVGVTLFDQQGFGIGSDSGLNLRGIVNSSRTNALVLVDGIRQNRLTGDEVHWQSIPLEDIERIEIIRGGGGLIYGEGALAGVINIIMKKRGEKPLETEEGVEVGSFGWQKYHLAARGRSKPFTYSVGYTRRLLSGYREFSWSRNTTIDTHTGIEFNPYLNATVNVLHSEDTTAFPGGLTLAQSQQRRRQVGSFHGFFDTESNQVSTDLVAGPWNGLSGVMTMFWRRRDERSVDSFDGNPFNKTPSRGLSLRSNYEWASDPVRCLVVSGVELTQDKATTGFPSFPPDNESNRTGYGLYVEDTLTLWDRWSAVAGLRLDRFRYQEAISFPNFEGTLRFRGFSPKVGLTYAAIPGTLDVFTSYSRPFKAPNVDDFAAQVSSFAGNVDLKPQQADSYEVGARFGKGPVRAEATWFYTLIDDEILFNQVTFQNQNFDTRRVGLELSTHLDLPDRLRSYVTYTLVDAEFRKGQFVGNTIPGTPSHQLNTGIGVSPVKGLWIDLDWEVVGDFYRINDFNNALHKARNYGVVNLTFHYDTRWARAFFTIQNLTNEEYSGFQSSNAVTLLGAGESPAPPTSFIGGVTLTF